MGRRREDSHRFLLFLFLFDKVGNLVSHQRLEALSELCVLSGDVLHLFFDHSPTIVEGSEERVQVRGPKKRENTSVFFIYPTSLSPALHSD